MKSTARTLPCSGSRAGASQAIHRIFVCFPGFQILSTPVAAELQQFNSTCFPGGNIVSDCQHLILIESCTSPYMKYPVLAGTVLLQLHQVQLLELPVAQNTWCSSFLASDKIR